MGRPVTLFTGQWADLPLETLCKKAVVVVCDRSDLALIFVPVIASKNQHRRATATGYRRDGNHHIGPASQIVRIRHLHKALLFARLLKIDRCKQHSSLNGRRVGRWK